MHPAADVFPMMCDAELDALGEDIKANGLREPIKLLRVGREEKIGKNTFTQPVVLLDGRNRLAAMERAGFDLDSCAVKYQYLNPRWGPFDFDVAAYVISANIRRRHLTKQEQADLIVAAVKASRQLGEVPKRHAKGAAGSKKDAIKEAAVKAGAEHGIGKRTVERSLAKAEGKIPAPKPYAARPMPKPRSGKPVVGIEAARRHYLDRCADPGVDLDVEQELVIDALREIAGKRAMTRQSAKNEDLDIPECLDRRTRP